MIKNFNRTSEKKSNCVNTLTKFFNPAIEAVEKLNFYDPDLVKESFNFTNNPSKKKITIDHKDTSIITSLSDINFS